MRCVNGRKRTIWQFVIVKNKLMSVFNASVLLLTMNSVIILSKQSADPFGYRPVDPQLLWQCYDEIHDQWQDGHMKNGRQFVKGRSEVKKISEIRYFKARSSPRPFVEKRSPWSVFFVGCDWPVELSLAVPLVRPSVCPFVFPSVRCFLSVFFCLFVCLVCSFRSFFCGIITALLLPQLLKDWLDLEPDPNVGSWRQHWNSLFN